MKRGPPHGDDVVAVDLLAGKTRGDRLLRQRLRRRLQLERHGNGPLIIVGDKHDGQLVHPGEIHRLPYVALGRGAVAEQANRDARLLSELEGVSDPGGLRRLRSHGDAIGKIVRRARGQIAALIAAPKQQDLLHLRSAPEQRAVVAVGGKEHVLRAHRAGDADRDSLLAERDGIGAEPPRALQRDRLEVEGACEHHAAIECQQGGEIRGKGGKRPQHAAVRGKVTAAVHLEAGNDGKRFVGHRSWSSILVFALSRGKRLHRYCSGFVSKLRESASADKRLGAPTAFRAPSWPGLSPQVGFSRLAAL